MSQTKKTAVVIGSGFAGLAAADNFTATGNAARFAEADAVLICVGTPLDDRQVP